MIDRKVQRSGDLAVLTFNLADLQIVPFPLVHVIRVLKEGVAN